MHFDLIAPTYNTATADTKILTWYDESRVGDARMYFVVWFYCKN